MITLREYINRVDKQAKADMDWAWDKKWIRLPVSVFLITFSIFAFVMFALQAIQSPALSTFPYWLAFIIIEMFWIYLLYEGVKGVSNKGGKR